MKVVLLNPPALNYIRGVDFVRVDVSLPPIGIAYLSSFLKSKGFQNVKLYDLAPFTLEESYKKIDYELIDTDIVGISCFTDRRASVYKLINYINNNYKHVEIVLGGAHPTFLYKQFLENFPVSAVFLGESEISFYKYLLWKRKQLSESKSGYTKSESTDKEKVNISAKDQTESTDIEKDISVKDQTELNYLKGVAFKDKNGNIIYNGPEKLIDNLDMLPFPDISDFNLDFYKSDFLDSHISFDKKKFSQLKQFGIITSRGCPHKCQYCSTASFWSHKVRFRSIENVISEIKYLVTKHKIEYILFLDDSFSIKPKRVIELCKRMIKEKLNILWSCITRVETVSDEMLYYMQKANCCSVSFGVESGSPDILKSINKKNNVHDIVKAFKLLKKYNIKSNILLMVGNIGESNKTISETLKLLKTIKPDSGGWGITTVFPGTELYNYALKNNYLTDDYWLTSNPAPYFCFENKYYILKWWIFKIQAYFIIKNKNYNLFIRYFLLTIRDILWIITGFKITKKRIYRPKKT